jgi:hypothetical protein
LNQIRKHDPFTAWKIDEFINEGIITKDNDYIDLVYPSYADRTPNNSDMFRISKDSYATSGDNKFAEQTWKTAHKHCVSYKSVDGANQMNKEAVNPLKIDALSGILRIATIAYAIASIHSTGIISFKSWIGHDEMIIEHNRKVLTHHKSFMVGDKIDIDAVRKAAVDVMAKHFDDYVNPALDDIKSRIESIINGNTDHSNKVVDVVKSFMDNIVTSKSANIEDVFKYILGQPFVGEDDGLMASLHTKQLDHREILRARMFDSLNVIRCLSKYIKLKLNGIANTRIVDDISNNGESGQRKRRNTRATGRN